MIKNIEYTTMSALDIISKTLCGKINPDPISQRPAISQTSNKSEGIVKCLINGYGIGMLTLRDIRNDQESQKIYPNVDYLVIDGGHRVRALKEFFSGRFSIELADGKRYIYNAMPDLDFNNFFIPCAIYDCTSYEATEIFLNVNETTHVNFMEKIMCDDNSPICREVRSRTKYYPEYGNKPHQLFDYYFDQKANKYLCEHWKDDPNPRRKWDEYVFIAIIKAVGGGNVAAGRPAIEDFAKNGTVTKTALEVVDRFLSDALKFKQYRCHTFNSNTFAAFQLFWFGLYDINKPFAIKEFELFKNAFMAAYTAYTGTAVSKYTDETILFDSTEPKNIKEFVRAGCKNYANSAEQKKCFELLYEEAKLHGIEKAIVFRDEQRTKSKNEIEELLVSQGYLCAIDGEPLNLDEADLAHNVSWASGGRTSDCAVIRRTHNNRMGQLTLDEYRQVLKKSA